MEKMLREHVQWQKKYLIELTNHISEAINDHHPAKNYPRKKEIISLLNKMIQEPTAKIATIESMLNLLPPPSKWYWYTRSL
jgi:uncharacterized protein (DUF305 family)